MPIIRPPKLVQETLDNILAPLFKNTPQRNHLANYTTGLMISANKTVAGMTNEMPNASDQSCLNRFLTEVEWDEQRMNELRIEWLQQFDDMQFHERGAIALDDVLLEKSGKFIPDSGTFWDHSDSRYLHAQDLIIANYVHPHSKKHYPLEFRRFKKADQCEWTGEQFKSMIALTKELIDWCHAKGVLGNFTFDSFYTCAAIQNHIHSLKNEDGTERGYIGDLKFNRKVIYPSRLRIPCDFAKTPCFQHFHSKFSGILNGVRYIQGSGATSCCVCEEYPSIGSQVSRYRGWYEAMVFECLREDASYRPQGSGRDLVAT
jgi:hypothetical protein